MATKKTLKGVIKTRKPRAKASNPRPTTGLLRPARAGPTTRTTRTTRTAGPRRRSPCPSPPHHTDEEVSDKEMDEEAAAAAKEEESALRVLQLAVKGAKGGTVTAIARAATEYIGELEERIMELSEALAEAETGLERAERALQEELETGEGKWLNEMSGGAQ